jgi:hypothetical protein
MGIVLPRPKIEIVESVKRCIDNPSISCCSRGFFNTTVLLWHLVHAEGWLTTKELCKKVKSRNCNKIRVYLYKLKKKKVVITSKIHSGETIWNINDKVLRGLDRSDFLNLLILHYKMCREYYRGNLKKPE